MTIIVASNGQSKTVYAPVGRIENRVSNEISVAK